MDNEMKDCRKCGERKSLSDFHISKLGKMGRKGQCKICCASRDIATRDHRLNKQKQWRDSLSPEKREEYRDANTAYYRSNPQKKRANTRTRQAAKIDRTPAWSDAQAIQKIYQIAANLESIVGVKFHVDHIIPLQGKLVSGLHVASNLQIIRASANCIKNNAFDPESFAA